MKQEFYYRFQLLWILPKCYITTFSFARIQFKWLFSYLCVCVILHIENNVLPSTKKNYIYSNKVYLPNGRSSVGFLYTANPTNRAWSSDIPKYRHYDKGMPALDRSNKLYSMCVHLSCLSQEHAWKKNK